MHRRRFLRNSLLSTIAATFANRGHALALSENIFSHVPTAMEPPSRDRVLVYFWMSGGNDGLNTIIPFANPDYAALRPKLAIKNPLPLSSSLGWHPSLTGLKSLYDSGVVALMQNVGVPFQKDYAYDALNVWLCGSDNKDRFNSGWLGRYLSTRFPNFPEDLTDYFPGIEFVFKDSISFKTPSKSYGLSLTNLQQEYSLIQGTDPSGHIPASFEHFKTLQAYISKIIEQDITEIWNMKKTNDAITNKAAYPTGDIAEQLKLVARLIAGGNKTPIYIVYMTGFSIWTNQVDPNDSSKGIHANVLKLFSDVITAFMDDLLLLGVDDRVLLMTGSEYGRKPIEDSGGVGRGNGAPHFVIGQKVNGGTYGHDPDLVNLDPMGGLVPEFDFRQIYASVLEQWFCVPKEVVRNNILFGDFPTIALTICPPVNSVVDEKPGAFFLSQNYPNPVYINAETRGRTTFTFRCPAGNVRLKIFDGNGREVMTVFDGDMRAGHHEMIAQLSHLAAGSYLYRLEMNDHILVKRLSIVK